MSLAKSTQTKPCLQNVWEFWVPQLGRGSSCGPQGRLIIDPDDTTMMQSNLDLQNNDIQAKQDRIAMVASAPVSGIWDQSFVTLILTGGDRVRFICSVFLILSYFLIDSSASLLLRELDPKLPRPPTASLMGFPTAACPCLSVSPLYLPPHGSGSFIFLECMNCWLSAQGLGCSPASSNPSSLELYGFHLNDSKYYLFLRFLLGGPTHQM